MSSQSHEDDVLHDALSTGAGALGGLAGILGAAGPSIGGGALVAGATAAGLASAIAIGAAGGLAAGMAGGHLLDQTNGHGEGGHQDVFDIAAELGVSAEDAIEGFFGSKEGDGSFGDVAGDTVGVGIGGGGGALLGAAELGLLGPMGLLTELL